MQFIIMNYYHRHKSAIIVIRVLSSSQECYHRHQNMLSSSSKICYHRHQKYAIIVIKICYHRHQNAIVFFRNCYHRQWSWCRLLQELLSSSMEVMSSRSQKHQYRFHNSEITVFTTVISSLTKFFVWFA